MRKYYGVAGTRGYGVYTNWNQAKNARRYTPHYKVMLLEKGTVNRDGSVAFEFRNGKEIKVEAK